MKKGIYVPLSCAILTVAALSGCSTTNKIPDATIENAIQDSTNIYSDYGLPYSNSLLTAGIMISRKRPRP